jgi:hypothetical protein
MLGETGDYTFCRQGLRSLLLPSLESEGLTSHCDILFSGSGAHRASRELVLDWVKEGSRYRPVDLQGNYDFSLETYSSSLYESTRLGLVRFIG